jgi:hypothetical protein
LLEATQGSIIQLEAHTAFFHELRNAIRPDGVIDQIADIIECKRFPGLSEHWQCTNNQQDYCQRRTSARRTNGAQTTSVKFKTGMHNGML